MKPLKLGRFFLDYQYTDRFRLFSYSDVFCPDTYSSLQHAFTQVDWVEKQTSFYRQYKSFVLPSDQHALAQIYNPDFFFPFKAKLEKSLGIALQNNIKVIAHKLISSHEIGVHNDYSDPEFGFENFRFIFQFAKPDQLLSGGELTFLASRYDRQDVLKQYSYTSNSGICFEITPYSYHMVTPVEGERHTLVLYLWEKGKNYDGSGTEISESALIDHI